MCVRNVRQSATNLAAYDVIRTNDGINCIVW